MSTTGLISPFSSDSLDIEAIKTKLRTYLIDNDTITDVDYDGSNISVLVQMLAFLEHGINSTIALNSNQTMLLLSDIRQNIIYRAQELSYNITRKQSSQISVTITSSSITNDLDSVVLPRFTVFNCGDFTFYSTAQVSFTKTNLVNNLTLIEGTLVDSTIDSRLLIRPTADIDSFVVNYRDIEQNSLFIKLKKSTETEFSSNFTIVNSLLDLNDGENRAYVELDAETEYIRVVTRFAGQGVIIEAGDELDISFLVSRGSEANGIVDCDLPVTTYLTRLAQEVELSLSVSGASSSGTNEETNDSIKANAPLFYNTGNRTINKDDYNSFLELNSLVKISNSWGGDEVIPTNLGHVYLTYIPQDENSKYLTNLEEADLIISLADPHTIAINLRMNKPNYIQMNYTITLVGQLENVEDKQAQLETTLTDYYNNSVTIFDTPFFEAKAIKELEDLFFGIPNASVKTSITPRLLLTDRMFDDFGIDNQIKVYIPNSPNRYYLVLGNDRIEIPQDQSVLNSLLIAGWTRQLRPNFDLGITFSGTINAKAVTMLAQDTIVIGTVTYDKQDIQLDGVTIGYFNIDLDELVFTTDISSDLVSDGFMDITYSDDINVTTLRNTIIELGVITFN